MRIRYWSSDVCSSDLQRRLHADTRQRLAEHPEMAFDRGGGIAIEGRAHRVRQFGERDVFGIENAVAVIEMVHLSLFSDQPSIVIPAQAGTHERHHGPVFAVRVHGSRIKSGMTKEKTGRES